MPPSLSLHILTPRPSVSPFPLPISPYPHSTSLCLSINSLFSIPSLHYLTPVSPFQHPYLSVSSLPVPLSLHQLTFLHSLTPFPNSCLSMPPSLSICIIIPRLSVSPLTHFSPFPHSIPSRLSFIPPSLSPYISSLPVPLSLH